MPVRRLAVALAALMLCGCGGSEAEQAEERFAFLQQGRGTHRDLCTAARDAADAWLRRSNEAQFEYWRAMRDVYCAAAETDPDGIPTG